MKLYKLTTFSGYTRELYSNRTHWFDGHTETKPRLDFKLCTDSVIHAYRDLDLGLLLNPMHANFDDPLPWECEGNVEVEDWSKVGCSSLTMRKKMPLPDWYANTKTRRKVQLLFAILCTEAVLFVFERQHPKDDRPRKAIEAAKTYLETPTEENAAAAHTAAYAAAVSSAASREVAYAAYYAAKAEAYAAEVAASIDNPHFQAAFKTDAADFYTPFDRFASDAAGMVALAAGTRFSFQTCQSIVGYTFSQAVAKAVSAAVSAAGSNGLDVLRLAKNSIQSVKEAQTDV